MNVRLTSAAYRELAAAAEYYEDQQAGLADRFLAAVAEAMERIARHPETWVHVSPRVQRCLVHRFPFALLYHVSSEDIQIVAVADLRRDPAHWEELL
jgi:plasmid stabilization system protein ParE